LIDKDVGLSKLLVRRRFFGVAVVVEVLLVVIVPSVPLVVEDTTSVETDRDRWKVGALSPEERRRREGGIPRGGNSRGLFSFLRLEEDDSGDDATDVTEDRLPVDGTLWREKGGMVVVVVPFLTYGRL
jgi:hypothetical protein